MRASSRWIAVLSLVALTAATFTSAAGADEAAAAAGPVLQRMITSVTGFDIGDGGPIADAWIGEALDVVVDPGGNLFFTDISEHRIRRVDVNTGTVWTIAGNGESDPNLNTDNNVDPRSVAIGAPWGLAMDRAQNLIFTDFDYHRIRYINRSDQSITAYGVTIPPNKMTTIAGDACRDTHTGAGCFDGDNQPAVNASLNFPKTIVLDAAQNIYFVDIHNFRIRKINRATGIITTVAGNGELDFEHSGDGGQAKQASLLFPTGVQLHPDGGFVISEFSGRIRRVLPNGIISTIAGAGAPFEGQHSGDGGPAKKAKLGVPQCLVFDRDGALLFSEAADNGGFIRRIGPGGIITTVGGSGVRDELAGDAAYSVTDDGARPTNTRMRFPGCFTFTPRGVYLAHDGNRALQLIHLGGDGLFNGDPSERITDVSTTGGLREPFRIDADAAGNVYSSENVRARVRRTAPNGTVTTLVGNGVLPFSIDGPGGDPRDNPGDGGPAIDATISPNAGVDIAPNGDLYLADHYTHRIRRVDAAGGLTPRSKITTVAVLPFPADEIEVLDPDTIYINDLVHSRVWRLNAAGQRTLVAGNGHDDTSGDGGQAVNAAIGAPLGLALDAAGRTLFIASVSTGRVRAVDLQTGVIRTVARLELTFGDETVTGEPVQVSTVGNRWLFVTDGLGFQVSRIDLQAPGRPPVRVAGVPVEHVPGFNGDHQPGDQAALSLPFGLATDGAGKVLIADGGNNRIRRLGLVDIRPGVFPNVIPNDGVVEVAFLSTYGFDATTLDPNTIRVAGGVVARDAAGRLRARRVDIDGDGRTDLVVQIERATMTLGAGAGEVAATAATFRGEPFADADWVNVS
jgi:sugar lactone lactonase YvrE